MRVSGETAATSQKNNTLKFIAFITGPENYSLPKKIIKYVFCISISYGTFMQPLQLSQKNSNHKSHTT